MINYGLIDKALTYYQSRGFQRIESPWTVTKAVSDITRPEGAREWAIEGKDKVLVASGEQSFLYLYLKGFLPRGKFVTATPCFRDEPFGPFHTKYFMKVELIDTLNVNLHGVDILTGIAMDFFTTLVGDPTLLTTTAVPGNTDINYDGIEIGSYGMRACPFLKWVYGTGLAEPRFSTLTGV